MTRRYGRAAPGHRVYDTVPDNRGENVSTIGALDLTGLRTGLSVPGAIDGETMVFFVEELLAPTLKRNGIKLSRKSIVRPGTANALQGWRKPRSWAR